MAAGLGAGLAAGVAAIGDRIRLFLAKYQKMTAEATGWLELYKQATTIMYPDADVSSCGTEKSAQLPPRRYNRPRQGLMKENLSSIWFVKEYHRMTAEATGWLELYKQATTIMYPDADVSSCGTEKSAQLPPRRYNRPRQGLMKENLSSIWFVKEYHRKKEEDGYENFEMPAGKPVSSDQFVYPDGLPEPERPPLRPIDMYIKAELPCLSQRFTVALLTCVGFVISFGMRCNMGMAKLQFEDKDNATKQETTTHVDWSVATESAVDSSFFWGYLVTQVPGGFLASRFPANRIFGYAIATSATLNLLVPDAIAYSPFAVILVRVTQGFVEGVTYPACHGIWRFWAPPLERSRLATIAFCGSYAGIVLGMPLSGLLTGQISWKAPFYFYGVVGLIWFSFWLWLVFEKPRNHPTITKEELYYIETSLGTTTMGSMPTFSTTPFREFFHSMPVYAIIVANFCRSWNFYLLVLYQASYLANRFHFKIEETGFIGALPHLLMATIVPLGGMLADHLRKNGILSTTNVRKLFNCGGFGCEAIFFLVVANAQTAFAANLALICGVALSGFAISGYNVNHLDIAPRYASILMGLSNGIGTIAGLICPIVIDHITKNHDANPATSWKIVFLMAATVHFIGVSFYAIFASGELQSWAEPTEEQLKEWGEEPAPPRPAIPPGELTVETSLTYSEKQQSYGTADPQLSAQPPSASNPFNQWGDEPSIVAPSQLDLSRVSAGRGNPFAYSNNVITEEAVQPRNSDYEEYRPY